MADAIITCPHCGRRNRVPVAASGTPRCGKCHQPLPWAVDAGDDTFAEVVEQATIPVVVDMWATWCGRAGWSARPWNGWLGNWPAR
jgi:thioredoxin 2